MPCPECNRKWRKVEGKYAVCECGHEEELTEIYDKLTDKEEAQSDTENA